MSNLMPLVIIVAAVIVTGYVLSIIRINFTRHLIPIKNQENSTKEKVSR
ncbi:MAG: hypothetical protein ACI935_003987 [Moritella dasanensis]|jgi:hypothetical protein